MQVNMFLKIVFVDLAGLAPQSPPFSFRSANNPQWRGLFFFARSAPASSRLHWHRRRLWQVLVASSSGPLGKLVIHHLTCAHFALRPTRNLIVPAKTPNRSSLRELDHDSMDDFNDLSQLLVGTTDNSQKPRINPRRRSAVIHFVRVV